MDSLRMNFYLNLIHSNILVISFTVTRFAWVSGLRTMPFPTQGLSGLQSFHSGLLFNCHVSTQVTPQRYCPSFVSVAVIKYTDMKQLSEREDYFRLQFRLQSTIIGESGGRNFQQLVTSCTRLRAEMSAYTLACVLLLGSVSLLISFSTSACGIVT